MMLDIIRATAGPRVVRACGSPYLISPPSNRMKAMLVAELERRADHLRPADAPPGWHPRLGGRASLDYFGGPGFPLLFFAVTRRDHPGLTLAEAEEIAPGVEPDDVPTVIEIAILDRPARSFEGYDADPDPAGTPDIDAKGQSGGIEAVDFGELMGHPRLQRFPPQVIADMTFDQMWAVIAGRDAERQGDPLSLDDACREIEEARREAAEATAEGREYIR